MNENRKSITEHLGDYVNSVLDLNKDGKVTAKEWLSIFTQNQALTIVMILVDVLVAVGEWRVWHVGYTLTGNPYSALGFVAVSAVPFYAAQVMWSYPRINGIQQFITVLVGLGGLITSAAFGFADLSRQYDLVAISKWVNWAWFGYVVAFILFLIADDGVRLKRKDAHVRASAEHRQNVNKTTRNLLADLRESLLEEQALRAEFGDAAVEAHLKMLAGQGQQKGRNNHRLPAEINPSEPPRQTQ